MTARPARVLASALATMRAEETPLLLHAVYRRIDAIIPKIESATEPDREPLLVDLHALAILFEVLGGGEVFPRS
jgi:hypothetical protein